MNKFLVAFALFAGTAAKNDVERALSKPGKDFRGATFESMNEVLNAHLGAQGGLASKACSDFSLAELFDVRLTLHALRDAKLAEIYDRAAAAGQKEGRVMTAKDLKALEAIHMERKAQAASKPHLHHIIRDGLCHETVMWFVHHLTEDARSEASAMLGALPLLPTGKRHSIFQGLHGTVPLDDQEQEIMQVYETYTECTDCHVESADEDDKDWDEDWPTWPMDWTYTATGYGPFPFFPPASYPTTTSTLDGWFSRSNMMEFMNHSSCDLSSSGGPSSGPCSELFYSSGTTVVYTSSSCCIDVGGWMTRRDFMNENMDLISSSETYSGKYYNGTAKYYECTGAQNSVFWYYTDLDDKPIEFGEGPSHPCDYTTHGLSCVYHQFDPSSIDYSSTIDSSVFELPDVCSDLSSLAACTNP